MDKALENEFLIGLEAHKEKLLRICTVYSKDEEERNDLFQEALMNIWKSLPSFQSKRIYWHLDVQGYPKRLPKYANEVG